MVIEWDDNKNRHNFEKHGIYFEEAQAIFSSPRLTMVDDRQDYGEVREYSIGRIATLVVIVTVHTERGGKTRLISARKANARERQRYENYLERTLRNP